MQTKKTWLSERYLTAKETVIERGFAPEVDWQTTASFHDINETDFLRESSWVILSAGMRETVIRQRFPAISAAFLNWTGAEEIHRNKTKCRNDALSVFAHSRKISAIISLATKVFSKGFERIKSDIRAGGTEYLQEFDYIGPITCFHLAKNLGLDVVKPDRHLVRLAIAAEYESPLELCREISEETGDRLAVVDLVLWRFATIQADYAQLFRPTIMQRAA